MQPGLTMTELFLAFVSSLVHSSTPLYLRLYIDVVKGYNEHRAIHYNTLSELTIAKLCIVVLFILATRL